MWGVRVLVSGVLVLVAASDAAAEYNPAADQYFDKIRRGQRADAVEFSALRSQLRLQEETPFTWKDAQEEFVGELVEDWWHNRLEFDRPKFYLTRSGQEQYLFSQERQDFEDDRIDDAISAGRHTGLLALKNSSAGIRLRELGREIGANFFAEQDKEFDDFQTRNRTRYGFMFGRNPGQGVDPGIELSDRPKFVLEWYDKSGFYQNGWDENGNAYTLPVLLRHRVSFKVTDLADPANGSRIKYELDNVRGWFNLNVEYDIGDKSFKVSFDDFALTEETYLRGSLTYHGEDEHFGFGHDRQEAPSGSVTIAVGLDWSGKEILNFFKGLNPGNWESPFQRMRDKQRREAMERKRQILLSTTR